MTRRIIVGSRGSKLALIQANYIVARLKELFPGTEVSLTTVVTQGDRQPHVELDHMEQIGVFVKELEEALLERRIDLAVHSLKDMPTEIPEGLRLAAVTERLDPRDVLVTRGERLHELPTGSQIGTGSLRRAAQILGMRREVETCSIRGNVDTRLRKVASGEVDGIILAAAAMRRLGWEDKITEYLPVESFLPAVGQGALGIEDRSDDEYINEVTLRLDHAATNRCVTAERAFLSEMGGGCRAPIAALGTMREKSLWLEGMVASTRRGVLLRAATEGDAEKPEEIGKSLARKIAGMGGADFIAEARSS